MRVFIKKSLLSISLCSFGSCFLHAFENTKILPKGVRNITIKSVNVNVKQTSDNSGDLHYLGAKLEKDFTLADALKAEKDTTKRTLTEALLRSNDFDDLSASLLTTTADIKSNIAVVAPLFSYGLTDRLTIAMAVPYYQAKVAVDMGVHPSAEAQRLVSTLAAQGQKDAAIRTGMKLNDFKAEMNKKLNSGSISSISSWNGAGLGDTTLGAKFLFREGSIFKAASTFGLVLPTGKVDDPDNLLDVPFGSGAWNVFSALTFDMFLHKSFFINQYAKYYHKRPAKRSVRVAFGDEVYESSTQKVRYKLGDHLDTGLSLQFEPDFGLVAALGYVYMSKYSDRYYLSSNDFAQEKLEENTAEKSQHIEAKIGYSSVPAFRRAEIAVPFSLTAEYKRHLASSNSKVKNLVTVDMTLYF